MFDIVDPLSFIICSVAHVIDSVAMSHALGPVASVVGIVLPCAHSYTVPLVIFNFTFIFPGIHLIDVHRPLHSLWLPTPRHVVVRAVGVIRGKDHWLHEKIEIVHQLLIGLTSLNLYWCVIELKLRLVILKIYHIRSHDWW